jgi:hypothetical protein
MRRVVERQVQASYGSTQVIGRATTTMKKAATTIKKSTDA